jgi:hypothetical protein
MDPQKQPQNPPDERQEFQPDTTISPRNPQPAPAAPTQAATAAPADSAPSLPAPDPGDEAEQQFYRPDDTTNDTPGVAASAANAVQPHATGPQMQSNGEAIAWSASEFIAHDKTALWYLVLGGGGLVLMGLVYLFSRDIFATVVVAFVVALFWAGAVRQPREMHYALDTQGLAVNNRHYAYGNFRSFAIAEEGPLRSINFMPMKRFMPLMSVYYDPADEPRITEVLADHLPREAHKLDAVERLMRRIRF